MKLSQLRKNKKSIIVDISYESLPTKFAYMEFIPGSEITILNRNHSKGPLHIKINENYLMIRLYTAEQIEVTTEGYE